jgi:hypothetical protein
MLIIKCFDKSGALGQELRQKDTGKTAQNLARDLAKIWGRVEVYQDGREIPVYTVGKK